MREAPVMAWIALIAAVSGLAAIAKPKKKIGRGSTEPRRKNDY